MWWKRRKPERTEDSRTEKNRTPLSIQVSDLERGEFGRGSSFLFTLVCQHEHMKEEWKFENWHQCGEETQTPPHTHTHISNAANCVNKDANRSWSCISEASQQLWMQLWIDKPSSYLEARSFEGARAHMRELLRNVTCWFPSAGRRDSTPPPRGAGGNYRTPPPQVCVQLRDPPGNFSQQKSQSLRLCRRFQTTLMLIRW